MRFADRGNHRLAHARAAREVSRNSSHIGETNVPPSHWNRVFASAANSASNFAATAVNQRQSTCCTAHSTPHLIASRRLIHAGPVPAYRSLAQSRDGRGGPCPAPDDNLTETAT